MTFPFPHRYETELVWQGGAHGILTGSPKPSLTTGPPPEFDGRPDWWSPEHLLLSAANSCLMTTFMVLAGRERLEVLGYRSKAEGVLEKTKEGIVFTSITLRVAVEVSHGATEEAERVLKTAKKYCIVSNSLKRPIEVEASVTAAPRPVPAAGINS